MGSYSSLKSPLTYVLLWDVSDHSTIESKTNAFEEAMQWPGFPQDPISPNPIHVDIEKVGMKMVKSNVPPLGGRKTRRGTPPLYTSLSNYNNLP